jgi:hypothetical protein
MHSHIAGKCKVRKNRTISRHNAACWLVHTTIHNVVKSGRALYRAKDIFLATTYASSLPQTTTEDEEAIVTPVPTLDVNHQHVFFNTTEDWLAPISPVEALQRR